MFPRSAQENAFTTRATRTFIHTHAQYELNCNCRCSMHSLNQDDLPTANAENKFPRSIRETAFTTRTSRTGGLSSQTRTTEANWTAHANVVCIPQIKLIYLQQMWKTCSHEASEKTHSQRGQADIYKHTHRLSCTRKCCDALRHVSTANVGTMLLRSVRVNALERRKRCHTHELM